MNNVEKALKLIEDSINKKCNGLECKVVKNNIDLRLENILSERDQDKARIKELEEKNRMLALEGSRVRLDLYIKQNYIPKQKVKEILDKAEVMDYYTLPDVINDLQELLEEGE